MFNNLFQQQNAVTTMPNNNNMFGGMAGMPMMGGFNQNNGLNFNNVAPAKSTSSTPEELNLIKQQKVNNFNFTDMDSAIAGWDFREGTQLAVEIVDPSTERVRVKYINEEFNIVMQPKEVLEEYLQGLKNFVYTAKITDSTDNPEVLKELFTAFGVILKLLPVAYENGKKNYQTLINQMSQMMTAQGYQGSWGGQPMFNGAIGAVPNYFVADGSTMGNLNFQGVNMQQQNNMNNPAMIQQMLQQAAAMGAQAAQQQMVNAVNNGMNNNNCMGTPMPSGGTMMGNNAFVVGGQPQQMPTQNTNTPNLNSIPMPPVTPSGTANPSMGTGTGTTTTVKI